MRKKRTSTLLLMKRLRLKLHSIPILINNKLSLKNNNKLRYISYSIPLASIVALVLVLGMAVNPGLCEMFGVDDSYALEGGDDVDGMGNTGEVDEEGSTNNEGDDAEADVSPLADEGRASIGIGGAGVNDVVAAAPGTTAYRSHDITIDVSKAKAYTLTISGPANLKAPAGTEIPITGAGNKLGSGMADYTWGYSWGTTTAASDTTADSARTYQSVSPTGTNLTVPALSNNAVNFSRKLVFAAKFGQLAVAGNYTAPVTLSLAVTPSETGNFWYNPSGGQTVYDAGSTSMQGISSGFCKNNSNVGTGWTVNLNDTRETTTGTTYKSYKIVKLKDGQCWMQENLNLTGPKTLTTADTDDPKNGSWSLPASVTSWNVSSATVQQVRTGSTSLAGWKQGYGNYYSWCAATAGTCVSSGRASGSICPRNWHLPSGNTAGEFQKLFGADGADLGSDKAAKFSAIQAAPYKFTPAGAISNTNGALGNGGTYGYYWSSTPSNSDSAYGFAFGSSGINPANSNVRYFGLSVRCVADF